MSAAVPGFSTSTSTHPSTLTSVMNTPDMLGLGSSVGTDNPDGFMPSTWNDDMMWQLFQSQPSLDWFNADILDPTWNYSVPK